MNFKEFIKKLDEAKSQIITIAGVIGVSFIFHSWMGENFVTKEHFDSTVNEKIEKNMNSQFLVLKRSIDETEYNVLGSQVASIKVDDVTTLTPFEIDYVRKTVRKHCMLGIELGYMKKDTDCETKVLEKLSI